VKDEYTGAGRASATPSAAATPATSTATAPSSFATATEAEVPALPHKADANIENPHRPANNADGWVSHSSFFADVQTESHGTNQPDPSALPHHPS
jgi:hypothetical protein